MHRLIVHLREPLRISDARKIELFTNLINRVCENEGCSTHAVRLALVGCESEKDRPFREMKPVLNLPFVNWERGLSYDDRYGHKYMVTNCPKVGKKFTGNKLKYKVHLIKD